MPGAGQRLLLLACQVRGLYVSSVLIQGHRFSINLSLTGIHEEDLPLHLISHLRRAKLLFATVKPLTVCHQFAYVRRTAKLNFPNETPKPPDPETILKLDNMVGLALGTSGETSYLGTVP